MKDEDGFTLIEVLIALAILAGVAASAALSFQIYGARAAGEERSIRAILLARSALAAFDAAREAETNRQGDPPGGARWSLSTRPVGPEGEIGGLAVSVVVSIGRGDARIQETLHGLHIISRSP